MVRLFILSIIPYIFIFITTLASADWSIYKRADLRNDENNIFRIDHSTDGSIRVWLILSTPKIGTFASKMPLYQIDDNDVRDLKTNKTIRTNKAKDRWIFWILAYNQDGMSQELLELINGKSIVFQYYLTDGSIKETSFVLKGIREVINEILK